MSSKASRIRYLLGDDEYTTSEIANLVGSSTRWVRACRARVRRPPSRYAVLLAQVIGLRAEVERLRQLVEQAEHRIRTTHCESGAYRNVPVNPAA